jgi:CDP-diacylglycerol--glycerol-3-phosphate 3-phosphatidyltransferase
MASVFDRWGEAIVYLGIAWGAVLAGEDITAVLATAALGAAFMVSYTRAKSEGLGFSPGMGMAAIGVMPREIRLVILSLGLIVAGATANLTILSIALAIIAVGAVITVIQRILQTRGQAESATHTSNTIK